MVFALELQLSASSRCLFSTSPIVAIGVTLDLMSFICPSQCMSTWITTTGIIVSSVIAYCLYN